MTNAVMSIDPRLVSMVGRKLYKSNALPIVIRELLQNSIDACKRKSVEPQITITIREIKGDRDWLVICEDNGIGMTEDQIVNDFLHLGGKKEDAVNQTGGFGIAKAAIMSGADWQVRSLDNYLDRDIFLVNGKIQKRQRRDGTKISVRIKEQVWRSDIRLTMQMIYYSDVKIHVICTRKSYPPHDVNDPNAGMTDAAGKILDDSEFLSMTGFHEMGFNEAANSWASDMNRLGNNVVRLNGLVQFLYGANSDQRKTNLFFDIKATESPDDPLYPFSMSRESLIERYDKLVDSFVRAHNANVIQSIAAVARDIPPEEIVEIIPGDMLQGSRSTIYAKRMNESPTSMGNLTISKLTIEDKVRMLNNSSGRTRLLIQRYKRDPRTKVWHTKLLLAWQDVLQLVTANDETFGIGITSDEWSEAIRVNIDGNIFYVLNPTLAVPDSLREQSANAIVLTLWSMACHEATHHYVDDHNEWFTTTMNYIQRDSAEVILRCLHKIAKRLL